MPEEKQAPTVQDYFTKDIIDRVEAMSDKDMLNLLLSLESTPFWIAIIKYNQSRLKFAQNSLLTIDPVEKPTLIARAQGQMQGISDLQNAVVTLKQSADERERQSFQQG